MPVDVPVFKFHPGAGRRLGVEPDSDLAGLGAVGLDGHDLRELGLKDGNLTVDDERTGKQWSFRDITLSVERPRGGGVVLTVGSDNSARPWGLTASIKPTRNGAHSIALEGRRVAAGDLLLAGRVGDGSMETNLPLSASLRGEIGADGVPHVAIYGDEDDGIAAGDEFPQCLEQFARFGRC